MTRVIVAAVFLVLLLFAVKVFEEFFRSRKPRNEYRRKDRLMTDAERECFQRPGQFYQPILLTTNLISNLSAQVGNIIANIINHHNRAIPYFTAYIHDL